MAPDQKGSTIAVLRVFRSLIVGNLLMCLTEEIPWPKAERLVASLYLLSQNFNTRCAYVFEHNAHIPLVEDGSAAHIFGHCGAIHRKC